MPLTLEQVLFIILTFAAVVAVTFFSVFLIQLNRTAREGERTLQEIRELAANLKRLEQKTSRQIEEIGATLQSARRAAERMSGAAYHLTSGPFGPAAKYWPLLFPLLRTGWRLWKKRKGEKI